MAKFITSVFNKSTGIGLRITIKSSKPIFDAGRRIGIEKGVYADFGKTGTYETNDEAIIEKLRASKGYGSMFYETGSEPQKEKVKEDIDLTKKTAKELTLIAKQRGFEVKEGMTKPKLLELLK